MRPLLVQQDDLDGIGWDRVPGRAHGSPSTAQTPPRSCATTTDERRTFGLDGLTRPVSIIGVPLQTL